LPLAGSSPLAELFQLCLTSAIPIDVMGLKQRSAPNKHKLKGGADLGGGPFFSLMASRPSGKRNPAAWDHGGGAKVV
jgi:hypothetical protein